jgi:hypothetical protein
MTTTQISYVYINGRALDYFRGSHNPFTHQSISPISKSPKGMYDE